MCPSIVNKWLREPTRLRITQRLRHRQNSVLECEPQIGEVVMLHDPKNRVSAS